MNILRHSLSARPPHHTDIMKNFLTILLGSFTTVLGLSALAGEPRAFPADLTHGNIRCVLMSVGQTTVFPNEKDNAQKAPPWRDGKQGVPCFTVTFLIEALGDAPSEPITLKNLEVLSAGKPLRFDGGQYHQGFDYHVFQDFLDFSKPKVSDQKQAHIMRFVQFGAVSNLQPLSLVIETGFGEDLQKFQFDSIQLRQP